jgi:hypothetical protein
MFQPQPTPYATFYGMGSGFPGHVYNQSPLTSAATYLGGEQGLQQVGGVGGAGGGGSYGPGSGVPVGLGGIGGIGASGAGAAGVTAAASGPLGATSLLFTSAGFTSNNNLNAAHNGRGPGPGACIPITSNNYPRHQLQPSAGFRRSNRHRTQPNNNNIKMESDLSADLAAQEAAAREYQPHLEVWKLFLPLASQL